MFEYYDKVVKGTENEDSLVIVQFLKGMVGQRFSFLNYYKEIPVSYDATLLSVENEMAEFQVHEYQAKVITMERRALIYSHEKSAFREDMVGEAFYVNIAKKRVILCKFGYGKIWSDRRRFVRVLLDRPVEADLIFNEDIMKGNVKDISLGGAALSVMSIDNLTLGTDINVFLKLPDISAGSIIEVGLSATIVKIVGETSPFNCFIEFHSEKHSQQQIAYYINQRQVEIIKELKELNV
ncbi:MAG: PilZ domain-containing protein [Geobacter sp.]|nr:MAG: PilZ domain-containing protein [Geobacter sp.]